MGGPDLILLDTHMWIWFHGESSRLPIQLTQALEKPETRIAVSVVSIWETMVAMEKGRIESASTPENTVRAWLRESPFEVIPLDPEIVLLSRTLSFRHDDPADRFIAATAFRLNCKLATADVRLLGLPWLQVLS